MDYFKSFLAVAALLSWVLFSSNSNETEILYWGQTGKLTWEDFSGEPRFDFEEIFALTSSGIMDYKGCKDGIINYSIKSYFEKKESWVKKEARTEYHLAHEQLHFDITELYARKLRKLLSTMEFKCGEEQNFEKFIAATLENWYNEQKNYDIITRHSVDRAKQIEWEYRIKMELSLLEDFAD